MAGQDYHLALSTIVANKLKIAHKPSFITGAMCVDGLNQKAGSRRNTHFTGGAGCIFPNTRDLRVTSTIQSWDSLMVKSTIVDPCIDLQLFMASNKHLLKELDYYRGILVHLIIDQMYDEYIQDRLFSISENCAVVNYTGDILDAYSFRAVLYQSYAALDNLFASMAGLTQQDIDETKELLRISLEPSSAEFVCKYLNPVIPEFSFVDTDIFKKKELELLANATLDKIYSILSK